MLSLVHHGRAGGGHFFFFNDTATTEIYTLSLHDALPICEVRPNESEPGINQPWHWITIPIMGMTMGEIFQLKELADDCAADRKSTRLNSSHSQISYAVFCLKEKRRSLPCALAGQPRNIRG